MVALGVEFLHFLDYVIYVTKFSRRSSPWQFRLVKGCLVISLFSNISEQWAEVKYAEIRSIEHSVSWLVYTSPVSEPTAHDYM